MQRYDVLVADDREMPPTQDWLMIEHPGGLLCVLKRSRATNAHVLADAWAAARRYQSLHPEPAPSLRATG